MFYFQLDKPKVKQDLYMQVKTQSIETDSKSAWSHKNIGCNRLHNNYHKYYKEFEKILKKLKKNMVSMSKQIRQCQQKS